MSQTRQGRRRVNRLEPGCEGLEDRRLPSTILGQKISGLEVNPIAQPVKPFNAPVMPFAATTAVASFIDPTVSIPNGDSTVISLQSYIAPYARLDSRGHAAIKIGQDSIVMDSAKLVADPGHAYTTPMLLVGNNVAIGPGAKILGPSSIGSYSDTAAPTQIGARAVVNDAVIEPGAIVSPLAYVGPGVTVPSGYRVLPGASVTTDAQASNPTLGKVVKVTSSDLTTLKQILTASKGLAGGYTKLYQGNSSTGVNIGASSHLSGIYNGYLPNVEGTSFSPGGSYVAGTKKYAPAFPTPRRGLLRQSLYNFPGRIIGATVFTSQRAKPLIAHLGRANSIRADVGQTITIGSIARSGRHVVITSPSGGSITIGQAFRAGTDAVVESRSGVKMTLGDNVNIGSGAVIQSSSLGSDSTVGPNAYLLNSTFPANTHIPAGAIYVNNKFEGTVSGV